ncbi:MAG: 16S rRNA (guanine(527)-N(7))-methyltransferase RsmG [Janthinobacterium lividum]
MADASLEKTLRSGLQDLGVNASPGQITLLLRYVEELSKWNAVYNLTAIRDPLQMVVQHLLDSLSVLPVLDTHRSQPKLETVMATVGDRKGEGTGVLAAHDNGYAILDVGSGGGLPGVVLAIMRPNWQVTVNDIVQKKIAFLSHVKTVLRLENLTVINGRVETLNRDVAVARPFDIIISRAFAELLDFVVATRHLLATDGRLYAMKGVRPDAEIDRLPPGATVTALLPLKVPRLEAQRHMVVIDAH